MFPTGYPVTPCLYPLSEDATPGKPSLSAVIIELLSTICKILSAFLLGLESRSLHFRQFKNGSDFLSKAVDGKTVGIWASIVPYIDFKAAGDSIAKKNFAVMRKFGALTTLIRLTRLTL